MPTAGWPAAMLALAWLMYMGWGPELRDGEGDGRWIGGEGRMGGIATLAGVGGGGREGGFGGSVRRRGGDGGSNGVAFVGRVCWLLLGPGRGRRDDGDGWGAGGVVRHGPSTDFGPAHHERGCFARGSGRGRFANRPTKMRGSGAVARRGHAAC